MITFMRFSHFLNARLFRIKLIVAVLFCFAPKNCLAQQATTGEREYINVMTFNIRFNNPSDSANNWAFRREFVSSQILFHETHILGVQEALFDQIQDLQERLPRYKLIGVGRDDGRTKGEFSAIFFDSTRFEAITSGTIWLSPTPSIAGSKGWDAALPRIATWVRLRDKPTSHFVNVINTHFDHQGLQARKESAHCILKKLSEMQPSATVVRHSIVMGDLNSIPTDNPAMIFSSVLKDSKAISRTPHYGPTGTFNGFGKSEQDDHPIDYIFVSSDIDVMQHATLSQTCHGRFSSDHFPVLARLHLK